jgi:hypothetical protein
VKKTFFRFMLVLAMISAIFLTPAVHATDSTKVPWDYLDTDEKSFVTSVRADVIIAKIKLDNTKANLDTVMLQSLTEWESSMEKDLTALNQALMELDKLLVPEAFTEIKGQIKALVGINVGFFHDRLSITDDLIEYAIVLGDLSKSLSRVESSLNNLSKSLENKVKDIGQQRERNEQIAGEILNSCLGEPGPP